MSFNLSQPKPIKSNEKKVSIWEKIWASLNMISLIGDMIIPSKVKKKIPMAQRNIIILLFLVVLIYLIICGIAMNVNWIIEFTDKSSFVLGNKFYYFGFITIAYLIIDFFNMDSKIEKHNKSKKIISSAIKDAGKQKNIFPINTEKNKNKIFASLESIVSLLVFIWGVWGIIFYDRMLFIILMGLSILFAIITAQIKNDSVLKKVFILEICINVVTISFIIINHFYILLP